VSVLSFDFEAVDMTAWTFLGLQTSHLHQVASSDPGAVELKSDLDPYSFASIIPSLYISTIRLIGNNLGDFDAQGIPHSGVVTQFVLFRITGPLEMQVSGIAVSPDDLLAAFNSQDPARLTAVLTAGGAQIEGYFSDGGLYGDVGDHLVGGASNDTLSGQGGHDTLSGGAGDDLIHTYDGTSISTSGALVDGGAGVDTIDYQHNPHGVTVDLSGGAGTDTISGVEAAIGSPWADLIKGSSGADTLAGDGGGDTLQGGAGNDLISTADASGLATTGALVDGGAGIDILDYGRNSHGVTVDLSGAGGGTDTVTGVESVIGSASADLIKGASGALTGGTGADTFHGFSGAGLDVVTDFNAAEGDRVQLDAGTTYHLIQAGSDLVIDLGNGEEMILRNVQLSILPAGWIFTL
jgi:hypothetical protein